MVHVRFEGESYDFAERQVDVTDASPDREIRRAVAAKLEVAPERLGSYVVDRSESGDVVVRPEAVYG